MKSGNLNFLELSGPLKACNGTALPLLYLTRVEGMLSQGRRDAVILKTVLLGRVY
jgi:hypothetical protein